MSCSVVKCAIHDVKEEKLICAALCGRAFHPDCAGIKVDRGWAKSKLRDHFICSLCVDTYDSFHQASKASVRFLQSEIEKNNQALLNSSKNHNAQDMIVEEMSKQFESFNKSIKMLEKGVAKMQTKVDNLELQLPARSVDEAIIGKSITDLKVELKSHIHGQFSSLTDDINNMVEVQEATNTFIAKLREDVGVIMDVQQKSIQELKNQKQTPVVTVKEPVVPEPVVPVPIADGWRTFGSRRMWKKEWVNVPVPVPAKTVGSFRYSDVRKQILDENISNPFIRSNQRKSSKNKSNFKPAQNPVDIDDLDNIIDDLNLNQNQVNQQTNKYSNFVRGSTLRAAKTKFTKFTVDPMRPPIVQLTQRSNLEGGRYVMSRLRDRHILQAVRLFLAFLYDSKPDVCYEGQTKTSVLAYLASEGLPTDLNKLQKLYHDYHKDIGMSVAEVNGDLSVFGKEIRRKRLRNMEQHSRYLKSSHTNDFFY